MTTDAIRAAVVGALAKVAPESRGRTIPGDAVLRDELDLDSMDLLNFVVGLHQALGIEVPESDYARLATLDGAVAYLEGRVSARAT